MADYRKISFILEGVSSLPLDAFVNRLLYSIKPSVIIFIIFFGIKVY